MYIAMTAHYWGVGETPQLAKKQAQKAGATARLNAKGKWLVKRMPTGAKNVYVEEIGDIVWEWEDEADKNGKTEIIERPVAP